MGKKKQQEELTFEHALEGLQEIVSQLENGQLGLSESLECYQRGVGLLSIVTRHWRGLNEKSSF